MQKMTIYMLFVTVFTQKVQFLDSKDSYTSALPFVKFCEIFTGGVFLPFFRCQSRLCLEFLRLPCEWITPVPDVVARRAETDQIVVCQCQLWVLPQLLYVMDAACAVDSALPSVQCLAGRCGLAQSCSAVLTLVVITL